MGSPAYFRTHEKPARTADLLGQRCVRMRRADREIYRWELDREGKTHEIDVPGSLILDQMDLTLEHLGVRASPLPRAPSHATDVRGAETTSSTVHASPRPERPPQFISHSSSCL